MRPILVCSLLLVCASARSDGHHLAAPPLDLTARALVHQKMASHSKQMTELVWAVVLLDYAQSASIAGAIGSEVRLARPTTGDATELGAALSPRFFDLQDQLRARARQLEVAARLRDSAATAKAYGALAETCVSCHDAFLSAR